MSINHLFNRIKFIAIEKKIEKNPYLGKQDRDGTYIYKEGSCRIRYRINKNQLGQPTIEWISAKRHLATYEEGAIKIRKNASKFWHYQGWLLFFRPPIIFFLVIGFAIFYFGLIETQKSRVEKFKWVIASVAGVDKSKIQYIGGGWIEISAERKTAVDKIHESVKYTFNPFSWLFSPEVIFVNRWRGKPYGYATHPVVYNERGEVWINKEGTWRYGKVSGKNINWDIPQGTGTRAGKVSGHEIQRELYTPDK